MHDIEIREPSATDLVLDLLFGHPERALPVQLLARGAEVMGIGTPSVRVALTRLQRQGRIVKTERGCYAVVPEGNPVYDEVEHWFEKESRLEQWSGNWLVVQDAAVARSAKTAWRHHERALALSGFRPLAAGINVRPDNLAGGAPAMRATLSRLGMAGASLLFVGREFDADTAARMARLWDVPTLQSTYRRALAQLERSRAKVARMAPDAGARETMLVVRAIIRAIVRDPLLPEAIMDPAPRRALIEATRAYQLQARTLWVGLLGG
ncbi:PaaX family transcriptional regulator C-terminal domain-containing protein [Cupriavidus basilensis]|uniref:PaaX family transcriptional regulator C-terminal domain-containing protein n=1 Tax=Cupriavidus basilensis TaxID=68895 RepID=A0ABT6APF1_9BURK|nr:PaaX family transcriptional regulator C-terminal domain-containing protein [Cupriavidus basilensis]MDF3834324.1 PaaX family transcriptional regulator C-terminal domain-containing protein [Cupriavidus basilensis]